MCNIDIKLPQNYKVMDYGVYMKFPKKEKSAVKETLIGKYHDKNTADSMVKKIKTGEYTSKFDFEIKKENRR